MANLEVDIELTTSGGQNAEKDEDHRENQHHQRHFQNNVVQCSTSSSPNNDTNPSLKSRLEEVTNRTEVENITDGHHHNILDSDDGVQLNSFNGGQLTKETIEEEEEIRNKEGSVEDNIREGTSSTSSFFETDCLSSAADNESQGDGKRASKDEMPNCDQESAGGCSITQSVFTSNADSRSYGESRESDSRSLTTILGGSNPVCVEQKDSVKSSTSVAANCVSEMLPVVEQLVDRIADAINGVHQFRTSEEEEEDGREIDSEESVKTFSSAVSKIRLPEGIEEDAAANVNDDEDILGEDGFLVVVSQCCECGEEMDGEVEAEEETEEVLSRDLPPCISDEIHRPFSDEVDSVGSERGDIVDLDDGDMLKLDGGMDLVDAVVGSSGGVSSRSSNSSAGSSGDVDIEEDIVVSEGDGSPKSSKDKSVMKRKQFVDTKIHCLGKKRCFSSNLECDSITADTVALEKTVGSSVTTVPGITQIQTLKKRIPTKENPPPELAQWLTTFQCWSNAERLLALDQMIDLCDPTQVRHMMCVIEPQFQRDFISLLPKELALYVLSFLEPKDLLRAAQTCKYWRILAEDNLLWREKCREAGIDEARDVMNKRRPKSGLVPSLWKAAYMRQHDIEMNWRYRPIRSPKVLKGHDDHVITCLQFSGSRIVSGSDDNTLKVWSATTGKCLKTLVGHTGGVWSSQMSGSVIVSGSTDRTLKVWNADTGQCIHTLYGHTSTVRCMHLHGHKVVSGSRDSTLRLWDIGTGLCLRVLLGHVAAVRCVQYDGRLVVSGAYDYTVKVWNPEREECLHTLQGHTNRVYSLQFDGVHVVSGSLDTSIRVWDVETGACKHTLMGHQSLTSGMELKNNILVSGNADSTVKVWDIMTGQCLQTLSGPNKHNSAVTCLQFNSKFVITSSDDGTVKLWDLKTGEFIRNLVALDSGGSGGVVWRIRASPTKLVCAVGSRNGTEETKLLVLDFDADQK